MVLILTPLIQGGESRSRRWRARGGASWSRRCRSAMAAMVCVIFRGKKHRTSGKIIYKWWIFRDFRGKIICACWNYVEFHGNIIYKWDCMKGKYRALVFFSPPTRSRKVTVAAKKAKKAKEAEEEGEILNRIAPRWNPGRPWCTKNFSSEIPWNWGNLINPFHL